MAAYIRNDALDPLYSEDLDAGSYKAEKVVKKPGWLKRLAAGAAISLPLIFGFIDKDCIGVKEANAAGKGYIAFAWCPPDNVPDDPFYYKLILTRQNNGQVITVFIPISRLRYNMTGLDEGVLYEGKGQTCLLDENEDERCSVDSANKPLGVARLYGNIDSGSVPSTINRVDSYDTALFVAVYTGRDTDPDHEQKCDLNGDGVVNAIDLNILRSNYGKVQTNPLGTSYGDCSEGRCPETGTCDEPY